MKYTKKQIRGLIYDWLINDFQGGTEDPQLLAEGRQIAERCQFAVIQGYAPEDHEQANDDYTGNILAVVWPSGAQAFDLFYLEDGMLEMIGHDCCSLPCPREMKLPSHNGTAHRNQRRI